jgi:hypothetical protein
MWYKLNESIGIILLVAMVGGGGLYGLYKLVSGPPLLRQEGQDVDPSTNAYAREIMAEHNKAMREIQGQIDRSMQEAMEAGNAALGR